MSDILIQLTENIAEYLKIPDKDCHPLAVWLVEQNASLAILRDTTFMARRYQEHQVLNLPKKELPLLIGRLKSAKGDTIDNFNRLSGKMDFGQSDGKWYRSGTVLEYSDSGESSLGNRRIRLDWQSGKTGSVSLGRNRKPDPKTKADPTYHDRTS